MAKSGPGPGGFNLPPIIPWKPPGPPPPLPPGGVLPPLAPGVQLPPIQHQPGFGLNPPPLPNRPAMPTEITWLRIISQQVHEIIRLLGGKGGGGGGAGGRGPGGGQHHALTRLGNFWTNIFNAGGGFAQVGRGLASGRFGQAAYGLVRAGQGLKNLEGMFGSAGGAGGAGAGGAAARGAAGAVGRLGGLAGAAGPAVAVVAGVVAVAAFVAETKKAADELIVFNQRLANVSASMGAIYAQREFREIMRERARGDALSNSTGLLVRGEQRFKDAVFPWETAWEDLKGNFLAGFYSSLADIAEGVNGIAKTIGVEINRNKTANASASFSDMVNAVADKAKAKQDEARRRAQGK
jgi:hypothetical protein